MQYRSVEDKRREQYSHHLPAIRMVANQLESEVRYHLLPISRKLAKHERIIVKSRVKDCESALNKLRPESKLFDESASDGYSLTTLKDLAAVRVLAFPNRRLAEIDGGLRSHFKDWTPEPFREGPRLGHKYVGHCSASSEILAEYQVVPMLVGLFWEVEHAAIYKPSPELEGIRRRMEGSANRVLEALLAFESEFDANLQEGEEPG